MTGIIKSGNLNDLSSVRPLSVLQQQIPAVLSRQEEEVDALHQQIASLEKELGLRSAAIKSLHSDIERAFEEGKAQGRNTGLAEAEDRQTLRFSLLNDAIRQSQNKLVHDVGSLERLSALLARECLDIIFGNNAAHASMVERIIASQIAKIDKSMVLSVEVSRDDFPDGDALDALAVSTALPRTLLTAKPGAATGSCLINLRLGRMDVGIDQQWSSLREVLGEMARPGEGG
jgi:flagellar biosynthesis/type III secretory pathway protein FliH